MSRPARPLEQLRLLGGALPLDFVNSVDWRSSDRPVEYLTDYDALLRWSQRLGTLSGDQAARLQAAAAGDPRAAAATLATLRRRREDLYAALAALATGSRPDAGDLDRLRRWYRSALDAGTLRDAGDAFALGWSEQDARLERPGWPIADAAWRLLSGPMIGRMRMCRGDGCGWLFVDRSKNATRRWCSMDGCGARMKMRRSYARARKRTVAEANASASPGARPT
jgi:predicted RNA-binding Zn ribbon-like protein